MANGIFYDGLQQHAGHHGIQGLLVYLFGKGEFFRAETHHLNVQVVVDKFQFLPQPHKVFLLAQQPAQDSGELDQQTARRLGVDPGQGANRIQGIE